MRNRDEDEGEEMYDDYVDDTSAKSFPTPLPSSPQGDVSPEMQAALEEFTFWNQEQIQGYFDQGWSIDQLRDWVNENN